MNLSQNIQKQLNEVIVKKNIDGIDSIDSIDIDNLELEFRFGKFLNKSFKPGINIETYLCLDRFLSSFAVFKEVNYTITSIFKNLRKIDYFNKPIFDDFPDYKRDKIISTIFMEKNKIKNIDIKDYNIRFSISKEKQLSESNWVPDLKDTIYKFRKRIIYKWGNIEFHLARNYTCDQNNSFNQLFYDIEIEIPFMDIKNYDSFMDFFTNIFMMAYQHTNKVIKNKTYKEILIDYQTLVKSKNFIGSKAESLTYFKIDFKKNYAVSNKLDGERKLLYIRKTRIVVINCNNFIWILNKEPLSETLIKEFNNTVLDTEYFQGKFYVFDVLYYKNEEVKNLSLEKRIGIYSHIVNSLKNEKIVIKEHYFNVNLFENVLYNLNNLNNSFNDGVILTPIEENSYNIPPLKFKDYKSNTVDFKIVKKGSRQISDEDILPNYEIWELYCYDKNKEKIFTYDKYNIDGKIQVEAEKAKYFLNNSVVEFKYCKEKNTFIPLKSRIDKQKGNYIEVIKNNIDLDLFPFQLQWLKHKNLTKDYVYFYNINRYKNYVQRQIIKKFKNKGNLLVFNYSDNDSSSILYKIIDNNIRNTFLIYKNEENLQEFNSKYSKISQDKTTKNFIFNFIQDIHEENYFNMVFFFDENFKYSEQMIKGLRSVLKEGCVIILFFYDLNEVNNPQNINSNSLFNLCNDILIFKEKQIKIIKDTLEIFTYAGFKLKNEVKLNEFYELWKYNDNFLTNEEFMFINLFKYYIFEF